MNPPHDPDPGIGPTPPRPAIPRPRTAIEATTAPAPGVSATGAVHVLVLDLGGPGAKARLSTPTGIEVACPDAPAMVLVRHAGRPVGLLDPAPTTGDLDRLVDAATARFGTPSTRHTRRAAPWRVPGPRRSAGESPRVSVIVATRERPDSLAACLRSLLWQTYTDFEVIVVDNAPTTTRTADLVRHTWSDNVRHVCEPRPGLAVAHNLGIAAARGELLAFTDDDVIADPGWLAAIVAGFDRPERPACVTGLILPAELRTPAQRLLYRHGGYAKGFRPVVYDRAAPPADPLFPFTAGRFGSGANMAFRADVLRGLGGFDPATGVGTPAQGGDDLLAFFRTIVRGHRIAYEPAALVWHRHHTGPDAVERQVRGYGTGLGAFLTAAVLREPASLGALVRRIPRGVRHALDRTRAPGRPEPAWSARLTGIERRALVAGPAAYLRARVRMRGVRGPWEPAR